MPATGRFRGAGRIAMSRGTCVLARAATCVQMADLLRARAPSRSPGSGFDERAAVREGLWHARRLPPFVAERPNPLSYLRRLRLRCRGCGRLEQASYEFRCAAGPRPPARDSSRVLKEG